MLLKDSRVVLGVLGELSSHIHQVISLQDPKIVKSLAMRYLAVKVSLVLRSFCDAMYGSPAKCVEEIALYLGDEEAYTFDNIMRLGEELIYGGDEVTDEFIEDTLRRVPELYVRLERWLLKGNK